MTLRQMMIKTMARTTLLMMFSPILKLELRPTISLLFCILELLPALRAVLEVFRRGVAAIVADLRPLALLLEEPLLRTSRRSPRRILSIRCVILRTSGAILCACLPTLLEVEIRLLYRNVLSTLEATPLAKGNPSHTNLVQVEKL